jgi:hypothetical protein
MIRDIPDDWTLYKSEDPTISSIRRLNFMPTLEHRSRFPYSASIGFGLRRSGLLRRRSYYIPTLEEAESTENELLRRLADNNFGFLHEVIQGVAGPVWKIRVENSNNTEALIDGLNLVMSVRRDPEWTEYQTAANG